MVPTTLAGLALLLIGLSSNVAAQRTLQDDGEIIVPVEDNAGHTYLFGYFEGGGKMELVIPDSDTHVNIDENGKATSIVVDGVEHTVEYDGDEIVRETTTWRTQAIHFPARQLQDTCSTDCVDSLESTCTALDDLCDTPDFASLLDCDAIAVVCSDLSITTSCTRTCAASCDPALNDNDNKNPACTGDDEVCCPALEICEVPLVTGACGDPHMTGFLGQKFDFTGEDGAWYCLLKDGPSIHLNMRVTAPVPSVLEITYITGLSVITTDDDGVDHTIDIAVTNPHSRDSSCPAGVSPCLADGALTVKLDGKESLVAPGEVTLGPGVAIAAANLPGACRSFGFEKYWERKKLQDAHTDRRLGAVDNLLNMGEWILSDPTATNMAECTEYVAAALSQPEGLFTHNSEHVSFQILTPAGTIRLSHGRLHQVAMRDPTDQFDLPEHLTWQMNVAVDHHDLSLAAEGVLGETVVLTVDASGKPIMKGIEAIRGSEDEYQVEGPLGTIFTQGNHHA